MGARTRSRRGAPLAAAVAILGLGCHTPYGPDFDPRPSRVAQGAVVGGMAGAAIGAGVDHRDRGRGALVGSVVGLLAGALLGGELERYEAWQQDLRAHRGSQIWCEEHQAWEDARDDESPWEAAPEPERVAPRDVLFDAGSSQLSPGARSHLRRVADRVRERSDLELLLRGHTDGSGAEDFDLSEQRARSVRSFLAAEGVPPRRIAWVGFGDAQPVASTRSPEGRQRNRRVEIVLREHEDAPYS